MPQVGFSAMTQAIPSLVAASLQLAMPPARVISTIVDMPLKTWLKKAHLLKCALYYFMAENHKRLSSKSLRTESRTKCMFIRRFWTFTEDSNLMLIQ